MRPSTTRRRSALPDTSREFRRGASPSVKIGATLFVHVISVYVPGAAEASTSTATAPPHASAPTASGVRPGVNASRAPAASVRRDTLPVPPNAAPFVTTQGVEMEPSTSRRPASTLTPPVSAFAPASVHVPVPSFISSIRAGRADSMRPSPAPSR